jgi:hypothetical protein
MCLADMQLQLANIEYSLLALAQGASMYKLCRPRMTLDNVVRIKGGRSVHTYTAMLKRTDMHQPHPSGAYSLLLRTQ